jgi:hypothetical protein
MATDPGATPVTTPLDDTIAYAALDVVHVAVDVTSCVDPFVRLAVAVNWEVAPTAGAVPVTTIVVTVLGAVAELLHAELAASATTIKAGIASPNRRNISCLLQAWHPRRCSRGANGGAVASACSSQRLFIEQPHFCNIRRVYSFT